MNTYDIMLQVLATSSCMWYPSKSHTNIVTYNNVAYNKWHDNADHANHYGVIYSRNNLMYWTGQR